MTFGIIVLQYRSLYDLSMLVNGLVCSGSQQNGTSTCIRSWKHSVFGHIQCTNEQFKFLLTDWLWHTRMSVSFSDLPGTFIYPTIHPMPCFFVLYVVCLLLLAGVDQCLLCSYWFSLVNCFNFDVLPLHCFEKKIKFKDQQVNYHKAVADPELLLGGEPIPGRGCLHNIFIKFSEKPCEI